LYVFWAIGELPAKEEAFLENITPNLQTTFKRGGNWQSIIAAEMDFLRTSLRCLANSGKEIARLLGKIE
jgi:hypothetical protein